MLLAVNKRAQRKTNKNLPRLLQNASDYKIAAGSKLADKAANRVTILVKRLAAIFERENRHNRVEFAKQLSRRVEQIVAQTIAMKNAANLQTNKKKRF